MQTLQLCLAICSCCRIRSDFTTSTVTELDSAVIGLGGS